MSHGITIRMLLMRYFKWTVEEVRIVCAPFLREKLRADNPVSLPSVCSQYHQLWNLENCQVRGG